MEKEQQGIEEPTKMKILIDSLVASLNKVPTQNTTGHDGIHWCWFKKFTTTHDILIIEVNRCGKETDLPEQMTKKTPKKELLPKTPDPYHAF